MCSLFAQDSQPEAAHRRRSPVRQPEGYLPAIQPDSRFATANVGGFANQPRSFEEIRDVVKWNTVDPGERGVRHHGGWSHRGESFGGPHYYILSTGGGGVSAVNRNAN
jgi:hypothetical protein